MIQPGTVFYDNVIQISTGKPDRQLTIVLNDGSQYPYLSVMTTSLSREGLGRVAGCQLDDGIPSFFLPLHSTYLKEETWIQLDPITETNKNDLDQRVERNELERVCRLPWKLFEKLLVCAVSSKTTSEDQKQELWRTMLSLEGNQWD